MNFEIIVTVLGIIQGILAMLNKRSSWIVYAIQMAALTIFSFYAKLYGDMVQSAVYMFICMFSFWAWKNSSLEKTTHLNLKWASGIIVLTIIATYIIGNILSRTDDPLPYVDSFTTVTTVVALLLMTAHKVECWLVWLINDIAYMYEYFNLPDQALYLFGLNCIWTLMAIFSYINWNRISHKQATVSVMLMLLFAIPGYSQDNNSIWLERSKDKTLLVGEFKDIHERAFNYLYVESEIDSRDTKSTYVLGSTDRKWWDKNIWVHGEFRTFLSKDFSMNNIYLIGPNFEALSGKAGFLNVQTMYRYDGKNNFQVSILSDLEWKFIYYSMFLDTYGTDKFYAHSENRLFFRLFNPVRIGGNLIATLNEEEKGLKLTPMLLIRVDL